MNIATRSLYCSTIVFVLFLIDIMVFFACERVVIYSALAWFWVAFFHGAGLWLLSFSAMLISLESFIYYGWIGAPLFYLIPVIWLGMRLQRACYAPQLQLVGLFIACLLVHVVVLEPLLLGGFGVYTYTVGKIIANILMILGLSLTLQTQGSQGNRL